MSSIYGKKIQLSLFGQSHGEMIGCVLDGLPAGETIDEASLISFLQRRAPGTSYTSQRHEADIPRIVSGLFEGKTCGAPLCVLFENTDTHSKDYKQLRDLPRPGHADFPAQVRYHGFQDIRGGGHFSARITAALCAAGGILIQILGRRGIRIGAHLLSVGDIEDERFDPLNVTSAILDQAQDGFPALSGDAETRMKDLLDTVREAKDSIGGIVECAIIGLPVGLGEPIFYGIENCIVQTVFAIPAVKGIEFGDGFASARLRGSQHNDAYTWKDGKPALKSNHAGGILGGLTDGAPIIFRAAFKPTPSIAQPQQTISFTEQRDAILEITGRHDPCVAVRAVPIVEAAAALAIAQFVF